MQRWVLASLAALACVAVWSLVRSRPAAVDSRGPGSRVAVQPTFPVRGGSIRGEQSDSGFEGFPDSRGVRSGSSGEQRRQLLRPRNEPFVSEGQIQVPAEASPREAERDLATRPKGPLPLGGLAGGTSAASPGEGLLGEAVLSLPFDDPKAGPGNLQPLAEKDVQFDEFGAVFGPNALFVAPPPDDVTASAGSVVFWLQPAWAGDSGSNNAYFIWRMPHMFENRVSIFKNGPFLRFLLADSLGQEANVGYQVSRWRADEWHHIGATWGDYVATFYIDGRSVGTTEYANDIVIPPGTPWYIGSDYPNGAQGANSRIRGFHVFPRVLQPEEVLTIMEQTRPPGA